MFQRSSPRNLHAVGRVKLLIADSGRVGADQGLQLTHGAGAQVGKNLTCVSVPSLCKNTIDLTPPSPSDPAHTFTSAHKHPSPSPHRTRLCSCRDVALTP